MEQRPRLRDSKHLITKSLYPLNVIPPEIVTKIGGYLVYFDLSARNANVAYYFGDSGNKFDGATKDSFRAALVEANDLTISVPNITLIGTDATDFNIAKMGSAKDVETLIRTITSISNVTKVNVPVNAIFDLQGRRVSEPKAPGIYIINGKKIFVK